MSFKSFFYNCVHLATEMCPWCGHIQDVPNAWDKSICARCHNKVWDIRP